MTDVLDRPAPPADVLDRPPPPARAAAALVAGAVVALALVATGLLPVPVLVLSLPFLYLLARRPVLRRLAVRSATRRPRETMLVLLGSLLGTAIITGSFVVGDTLDASIRRSAFTQLGPVDEVVQVGSAQEAAELARRLEAELPREDVDGVLPVVGLTAAVATAGEPAGSGGRAEPAGSGGRAEPAGSGGRAEPAGSGGRARSSRAEPQAQLYEVDFDAARAFGDDPEATGIEGPTPAPDQAVLTADLARALGAKAGDTVSVFAYGARRELRVDRVLPRLGLAGLRVGFGGSESPNVFVAPGTVERLRAEVPAGPGAEAAPPVALVAVSNRGGVVDGARRSDAVTERIEGVVGDATTVTPVKADRLDAAEEQGAQFATLFTSIGFFSVLAGVLLLVNIFVALAQERKTEFGMLRAVGLRRASLVGSFSLEGWLYALAAAALGTVVGIGVGRLIVVVAADIFGSGDVALELGFAATLASIQQGFTLGFAIALVTVLLCSLALARLNVIRAIRDLPEPTATGRQRLRSLVLGAVLVVVGGGLTAAGVGGGEPFFALGGPGVVGLGLVLLLARLVPRRLLVSAVSVAVLAWAVVAFDLLRDTFEDVDIPIFVLQGVLLTGAAVSLVSVNQDLIGAAVRRVGGGSRSMALRLGLAYPLARRFRTGMILSMYSLVVFTLTFITLLSTVFSGQIEDFTADVSGGYDVVAKSNPASPVPAGEVRARPEVEGVAELALLDAEFDVPKLRTDGFEPWSVAGFDEAYFAKGRSLDTPGNYPSEEAAFQAVAADPSLVLVSEFFLQDGGGGPPGPSLDPGDRVTMRDPLSGRTKELTVAALAESGFSSDYAYVSRRTLDDLFGARAVTNVLHVDTAEGTNPEAFAAELNSRYLANGADAETFRAGVSEGLSAQTSFFRLLQGYLALGLLVGVAGLGVVAVRAVRERRRQVGVLRSLGFEAGAVRRAFLAESAFVALEGILIGVGLALIVTWRLIGTDEFGEDLPFVVPWGQLALLVAGTLVASLLATAAPAQQASRIRPAVALRTAD